MEPVVYERQVYYYETDRMGCVHHSNYIRWFEEARVHFMRERGFPFEELEAGGLVSPVLQVEAQYKSMARFGEAVRIEVWAEDYTGTRISFRYRVRDKAAGTLRCLGRSAHCFLNGTGRPVSIKKALPAYDAAVRRGLFMEEQPEEET